MDRELIPQYTTQLKDLLAPSMSQATPRILQTSAPHIVRAARIQENKPARLVDVKLPS